MDFNNLEQFKDNGFLGFKSIKYLWLNSSIIPKEKGVYLVINPNFSKPEYLETGVGGFFKGRNPNIPIEKLNENHVLNSQVVYIGKAGSPTGKATLHSRLNQYLKFGKSQNVGHWGGRLIWQLKNHSDLIICWKKTPNDDPRDVEKKLLKEYILQYGKRPFANLTG